MSIDIRFCNLSAIRDNFMLQQIEIDKQTKHIEGIQACITLTPQWIMPKKMVSGETYSNCWVLLWTNVNLYNPSYRRKIQVKLKIMEGNTLNRTFLKEKKKKFSFRLVLVGALMPPAGYRMFYTIPGWEMMASVGRTDKHFFPFTAKQCNEKKDNNNNNNVYLNTY